MMIGFFVIYLLVLCIDLLYIKTKRCFGKIEVIDFSEHEAKGLFYLSLVPVCNMTLILYMLYDIISIIYALIIKKMFFLLLEKCYIKTLFFKIRDFIIK